MNERRTLILQAAQTLFLERGFRATTLHDIVTRSGGSMTTIYSLFKNKVGLLRAIIDHRCEQILSSVDIDNFQVDDPESALTLIATDVLDRLIESVSLLRLVVAESIEDPDLGRLLYERGVVTTTHKLTEIFERLDAVGALNVPNPVESATMFHRAVIGQYELRLLLGLESGLTEEERRRHIGFVVAATARVHRSDPMGEEIAPRLPASVRRARKAK